MLALKVNEMFSRPKVKLESSPDLTNIITSTFIIFLLNKKFLCFAHIVILRHNENMEAKSSSQLRYFWRFFTRCLPIAFTPTSAILFTSEREITFSPNCSKFVVECDWNRKNSQNVQNFGFFAKKKIGFFEKKSWNFSKSLHVANFF